MRLARLLCLLISVLAASYAHATWSLINQAGASCTATLSTCAASFVSGSTTAGDIIIVALGVGMNDPITGVIDNATGGSSTYTVPTGSACVGYESTSTFTTASCAYCLNVSAGATQFTASRTTTTSTGWQLRVLEFRSTTTVAFDVVGTASASVATTSPVGPALTLTGTNDVVVQIIRGTTPTAISAPYTYLNLGGTTTLGYALNSSTAPAPTWTQTSAKCSMAAIAIMESGGGAHQPRVDVITENRFP